MLESPFREEDLAARVEALQAEHDALVESVAQARRETARLRPWSWKRFFFGLVLLPVSVMVVVVAVVR